MFEVLGLLGAAVQMADAAGVFGRQPTAKVNRNIPPYRGGVNPVIPYPSPPYQGRVKGLFIGINYKGTTSELRGCINDVRTMLTTLQRLQFPLQQACILVDDPSFPGCGGAPTRNNIIQHLQWLVGDARPGDTLFLHYSGHGAREKDLDGDEEDGYDETLVPLDYQTAGTILDDDLFAIVVKPLPPGVRLTAVMDCCHSGSLLDLPFTFAARADVHAGQLMSGRKAQARMSQGDVCMFSGCSDSQTSADVSNTADFGNMSATAGGACTNALAAVLTKTAGLTFSQLLNAMRQDLQRRKYTQVPELSSSKPIDLFKNFSLFGPFVVTQSFIPYQPFNYPPQPYAPNSRQPYPPQYPPQQYPPQQYPPQQYPPQQYPPQQYPPQQYPPQQYPPQQYPPQQYPPQQYPPQQYPPQQYPPQQYPPQQYPPAQSYPPQQQYPH